LQGDLLVRSRTLLISCCYFNHDFSRSLKTKKLFAEYKHIVLGLIFLKYISDAFEVLHQKLIAGEGDYAGANPEDRDEYSAENVFSMEAIERENAKRLKGILPKVYGQQKLDQISYVE